MTILAAATDAHSALFGLAQATPTPHPSGTATAPAEGGSSAFADAVGAVLGWLGDKTGLGVLGVLLVIGGLAWAYEQAPKSKGRDKAKAKERDEAIGKAFAGLGRFVWRVVSGRPLAARTADSKAERGGAFWEPIPRPVAERQALAAHASVALAGPVSAPFDLDAKLADFQRYLVSLVGKAPTLLLTIADWAAVGAVKATVGARWAGRALRGLWVLPRALWRSAATYPRWAYSWVLCARLATLGGALLYSAYPGGVQLGAGAVALVAVGVAATGPDGLGYWQPPEPTDEEVYADDLWFLLRMALRLPEDEKREKWLTVPAWFVPGDPIRLELPKTFVGTERERAGLDQIVKVRLPGVWVSQWTLMGGDHHVLWNLRVARDLVGDEATYGPALWPILREQIALPNPEEAWMEDWLTIPADLSDEDATVRLVLPLTFVGAELDRQALTTLINLKLPGEWVARWQIKSGQQDGDHWVQWTHKPPAPPKPACPDFLDFFDPRVQEAIFSCAPGEVVVGMDAFGEIVKKRLEGDSAHWALSIGSGGGKSNLIQFIILQLVWQGWTVVATDPKRNSVACFAGLPGFYLYNDPMAVGDMRRVVSWFRKVAEARQYVQLRDPSISLPGAVLIMEEANETADLSREWWRRNKPKGAPAGDPFWGEVASTLRTARSVNGHVIGVFQDLRDDKTGNQGMSVLFPEIIMGKIKEKQWDRIIGGRMPDITGNDQAGRILVNRDGERIWLQVPSCNPPEASPARYMEWAQEARSRRPWTYEAAGLYGTPPKPQEQEVPALLRGTSHDPEVNPTPAVLMDKIPAQSRDSARTDMPHDAVLDALRDAVADGRDPELRAALLNLLGARADKAGQVPAEAQQAPAEAQQAPAEAPEERLPIAEIARRFKALEIPITEANIRQHKTRHKEKFPTGTGPKGNLFLASEIRAYFQEVDERKQKRVAE